MILSGWRICLLDSTNANESLAGWTDLAQGELGEAELDRAECAVAEGHQAGLQVCLALHHTALRNPRGSSSNPLTELEIKFADAAEKLLDLEAFRKISDQADLVLCGHTHIHGHEGNVTSLGDCRGTTDHFILE